MLRIRKGNPLGQQLYKGLLYNIIRVRRGFGIADGYPVYRIHMRSNDSFIVISFQTLISFDRIFFSKGLSLYKQLSMVKCAKKFSLFF